MCVQVLFEKRTILLIQMAKKYIMQVNPRYTAGDNLGESSIDEQEQWLNLYSNNSHTQV